MNLANSSAIPPTVPSISYVVNVISDRVTDVDRSKSTPTQKMVAQFTIGIAFPRLQARNCLTGAWRLWEGVDWRE